MISIDDFKKLEIKVGEIKSAEKVPETDKLLKLSVDFGLKLQSSSSDYSAEQNSLGERDIRQVVSGISKYFPDPGVLIGKKCAFAYNLEPRTIKGLESQGMILAVSGLTAQVGGEGEGEYFSLLEVLPNTPPGSSVK